MPNFAALFAASSANLIGGATPETRTRDQYVAEIDAWEAAVRRELPKLLDKTAGYAWDGVMLRVRNNTDTYLDSPEFEVHIEGPVEALRKRDEPINLLDKLPNRPRRWGPIPHYATFLARDPLAGLGLRRPSVAPTFQGRHGIVRFENGGSVDLRLSLEELRPRATYTSDDDDLVLILRGEAAHELHGTWRATVRGHHVVYGGELQVPVSPDVNDFSGSLTRCFEHDEDLKPDEDDHTKESK